VTIIALAHGQHGARSQSPQPLVDTGGEQLLHGAPFVRPQHDCCHQPRPARAAGGVYGDPAEELAKVARDRQAGLVVMGLHGSPLLGPRMGSVTYRMLCLLPTLVLALPPDGTALDVNYLQTGDGARAGQPLS
jgi:Universal stress protein family